MKRAFSHSEQNPKWYVEALFFEFLLFGKNLWPVWDLFLVHPVEPHDCTSYVCIYVRKHCTWGRS